MSMLAPGQLIAGRYRLKRLVGTGGMGAVWVADHVDLDVPVAIKFQHAPLAEKAGAAERFQREARMAARLRSPHVVRIHDYGVDSGIAFMAMELFEGESLRARLDREERVTPREASRILRQAAAGLDVAHASGVVHRDIKPSNLFLAREGDAETVKLLDFGIAKWSESDGDATASSVVLGSARYMSPEQARGEKVDRRSDVWSLGVVAYEMLVGEAPFQGASLPDTTLKICSGAFEKPSDRLGASYLCFDAVFAHALAVNPSARPGSASELVDAFARAAEEWKGSGATVGRESDTATMRATVSARPVAATRSGAALFAGILALVAVASVFAWQTWRGETATATTLGTGSNGATARLPAPRSTTSASDTGSGARGPKEGSTEPMLAARSASTPAPQATASDRPVASRSADSTGRAPTVRRAAAPPRPVPSQAGPKARNLDPDFGLAVPTP